MINVGIFDGDKVIVKQKNTAQNGDLVVALFLILLMINILDIELEEP